MHMGGRFGKYGDTKRKAKIQQSGIVRKKTGKLKPDPGQLKRRQKKKADKKGQP